MRICLKCGIEWEDNNMNAWCPICSLEKKMDAMKKRLADDTSARCMELDVALRLEIRSMVDLVKSLRFEVKSAVDLVKDLTKDIKHIS